MRVCWSNSNVKSLWLARANANNTETTDHSTKPPIRICGLMVNGLYFTHTEQMNKHWQQMVFGVFVCIVYTVLNKTVIKHYITIYIWLILRDHFVRCNALTNKLAHSHTFVGSRHTHTHTNVQIITLAFTWRIQAMFYAHHHHHHLFVWQSN